MADSLADSADDGSGEVPAPGKAPALEQLHRKLMERNVAQEIASK